MNLLKNLFTSEAQTPLSPKECFVVIQEGKDLDLDLKIAKLSNAFNSFNEEQLQEFAYFWRTTYFFELADKILKLTSEEIEQDKQKQYSRLKGEKIHFGFIHLALYLFTREQLVILRKYWLERIPVVGFQDHEQMAFEVMRFVEKAADGVLNDKLTKKGKKIVFWMSLKSLKELEQMNREKLIERFFGTMISPNWLYAENSNTLAYRINREKLIELEQEMFIQES